MNIPEMFKKECVEEIQKQGKDEALKKMSREWVDKAFLHKYSYHFEWLGRPIIQFPQDMIAMQEIIASVRPDLIIEAGIAHGGSLIFYASLLELNAVCGGPADARVLGIDIDIREHNRKAIEAHPMFKRITMLEGSSIAPEMIQQVREFAKPYSRILVSLDSNHVHDHVLAELEAYAPLVSSGSYCVAFDTLVEYLPGEAYADRPWGKGNNPLTAVKQFLQTHPEFSSDEVIDAKLLITGTPSGYLKRS